MKLFRTFAASIGIVVLSFATASAATSYWDVNGATDGASAGATAAGTWDGAGGDNWSTDSTGNSATGAWVAQDDAVFSAGTNATGSYTVTITNLPSVKSITMEEGGTILQGGDLTFDTTAGVINIATGSTWNNSGAGSGDLAGTAGITKTGGGTINMGSIESFTSASGAQLTISAGVVTFSGDGGLGGVPGAPRAAAVTINGGTLRYVGTAAHTLNINRGVTIGALGGTIDVPSGTGTGLSLPASATFTLNGGSSAVLTKIGTGRFTMNTTANTYTGKYVVNAGSINVPGDGRFGTVPASAQANYFTLDGGILRSAVTGGTSWSANRGITLLAGGGTLAQPGAGTTTDSLTYNGIIAGTAGGGLTIASNDAAGGGTADGIIILGGASTYNGPTTVNASMTLRLGANNVLPNTALSFAATSATFDLNNFSDTIGSIGGSAAPVTLGSGTLTLGGGDLTGAAFNGIISGTAGTGAVAKTGTGVQSLGGASTYTGGFTLNDGTIRAGNVTASGAANSAFNVTGAATLASNSGTARVLTYAYNLTADLSLGQASGGTGVITMAGTVDLGGGTRTITTLNGTALNVMAATISNGNLTKAGAANMAISSANASWGGNIVINQGRVEVQNVDALGDATGTTTVLTGGELHYSGQTYSTAEPITISGSGTLATTGAIQVQGGSNVNFTATVTLADNATVANGGTSTGTYSAATAFSATDKTLTLGGGSDNGVVSGDIALGTGGLAKQNSGTWLLSNATGNSYSGTTAVNAGTLVVTNTSGSGTGSADITVGTSGAGTTGSLSVGSGGTSGSIAGNVSFVNTSNFSSLRFNRSDDISYTGLVSGAQGVIQQRGTGTLTLPTANTHGSAGGGATIADGGLALGHQDAIGASGSVLTIGESFTTPAAAGGIKLSSTTALTGANAISAPVTIVRDFTVPASSSAIELAGATNLSATAAVTRTITVDSTAATTISGAISDGGGFAGTLAKAGTGTLTLTGSTDYTGDTKVDAGTLSIGAVNLADAAAVYIAASAVMNLNFAGTDTISALYINNVLMGSGTFGTTASGASNPDDVHFSGLGKLSIGVAGEQGDYDNNGVVDTGDYVLWRMIYEEASPTALPYPATEVDTVGTTNLADYTEWAARFNNPLNPPSTVNGLGSAQGVPEPTTLVLLMLGLAAAAACGRRR